MSFWSDKITPFSGNKALLCGNIELRFDKPLVMGILNLTPDSFYDGGKYSTEKDWVSQTAKMILEGASIIDLGAVSTRPGAREVSEAEEISRLLPALKLLKSEFPEIVFSADTYRSQVVRMAAETGAGMINDISGGDMDTEMINAVAATGLPYILMHMQGTPSTMQANPIYTNVTQDVIRYFEQKLSFLYDSGVNQVILDPGFGFGKSIVHNYQMLQQLNDFKQTGFPLLVGISRKSMIYKLLKITPEEALPSTTALHLVALLKGADILRVHDVKEAVEAIKLAALLTMA